jgi:hypothetical protein
VSASYNSDRFWSNKSCGRGVVGCVPVFQTGGVRFDPGRPRQPAIAWCKGYGAFNAGRRGLNSRWQDQRLGASPSWPRRRISIPVTAGSNPAALANFSRGLGREGTGSHKAGVAGSTPAPATNPDFVQWQDARLWTGRRGVRFSQSGPDTGLVQWQNAGLQNPMSTVRFSQPVPMFFTL